jgi:hypothetical protein
VAFIKAKTMGAFLSGACVFARMRNSCETPHQSQISLFLTLPYAFSRDLPPLPIATPRVASLQTSTNGHTSPPFDGGE